MRDPISCSGTPELPNALESLGAALGLAWRTAEPSPCQQRQRAPRQRLPHPRPPNSSHRASTKRCIAASSPICGSQRVSQTKRAGTALRRPMRWLDERGMCAASGGVHCKGSANARRRLFVRGGTQGVPCHSHGISRADRGRDPLASASLPQAAHRCHQPARPAPIRAHSSQPTPRMRRGCAADAPRMRRGCG
jgi:hypothetical protein